MNDPKDVYLGKKTIASVLPFLIVMGFILSCSIFAPEATPVPTDTPRPTETEILAPADTELPTDTPEPTQKATVNKAATNRAKEEKTEAAQTEFAGAVLGEVESKLDEVGEIMGYGSVIWLYPSPIEVESSQANKIWWSRLDPSIQAADFAFHTIIKWETKQAVGLVNCVIIFRLGDDPDMDHKYMMRMGRISGAPHIWFQLLRGWNIIAASDGHYSSYIRDEGGAENEIVLTARANEFRAYANGHQVDVWWNTKMSSGGFGLGTWQDTGQSVCTFRDNWIWKWAD